MLRFFRYQNITYKREHQGEGLVVSGEITNASGRSYHSVVFRIVLFIKSIPIGNAVITINGFINGQTRTFEKRVGDLAYNKVIQEITNYDIYPESGY
jgi:proteasome assembly chaperone (PAC2) family protein